MLTRLLPAFLCLLAIVPLQAAEVPEITAKSAILLDANTGKVLYSKNDDAQRPVASTQKLITALIVAETGDLDLSLIHI
jgi:D-alanyl-D-alanine carboxypeptidase (penicillin-binding protein 5/6)